MFKDRDYIIKNIKSNPLQSLFLFMPVCILSFLLFGGLVIDSSLQKGMDNMEKRLGADLMLVPEGEKQDAEDILLEGARGSFYFDKSIYEKVSEIEGIDEITFQFFLKSLSADCCSSEVEIVFFDPETDFLIAPWISKEYKENLKKNSVVIGNSISDNGGKIKLFGREYKVSAKMAKTGTSLDNSVYFSFDSFDTIISDAVEKGSFLNENQKNKNIISSVFINVKEEYKIEDIISECHVVTDEKFDIVYPKQLGKNLSLNLKGINTSIHITITAGGVLLLLVLLFVNGIIANGRKREVALFRIFGVSKKVVLRILSEESMIIGVSGSLAGCLLSTLFVIPFGNYIGVSLDMPYLGPDIWNVIILYIIISLLVVLIVFGASIYPVLYISNMQPYIAIRKEGE